MTWTNWFGENGFSYGDAGAALLVVALVVALTRGRRRK